MSDVKFINIQRDLKYKQEWDRLIYNNNPIKKEKTEVIETTVTLEKEIIHDTIFIERPKPINVTTLKKETKLIQSKKIDTLPSFNDSIIK